MSQQFQELCAKDEKSLISESRLLAEKLMSLRFQQKGRQLKQPSEILKVRRTRARVETALTYVRRQGKGK